MRFTSVRMPCVATVVFALMTTFGVTTATAAEGDTVPFTHTQADDTSASVASTSSDTIEYTEHIDPTANGSITPEQWEAGIQELIDSEMPRTVNPTSEGTSYTFHIPIDDPNVAAKSFDFTVVVPKLQASGELAPMVGGGVDVIGPYLTLSLFEQNLLLSGAASAVAAAACLLPFVGWIGCVAIHAAVIAAAAWISTHGLCPSRLKAYIFTPERNRCIS